MTYTEQLRHPKWQRRRLEIMSRDGFRCTRCTADDKTLNVHHKQYRRGAAPWEYADDELVTLCEDCHGRQHALGDLPVWARAVCHLVDQWRGLLSPSQVVEVEMRLLVACCETLNREGPAQHDAAVGQELATLRAADQAWRVANPDEAAALDERKRVTLEQLRRPH